MIFLDLTNQRILELTGPELLLSTSPDQKIDVSVIVSSIRHLFLLILNVMSSIQDPKENVCILSPKQNFVYFTFLEEIKHHR